MNPLAATFTSTNARNGFHGLRNQTTTQRPKEAKSSLHGEVSAVQDEEAGARADVETRSDTKPTATAQKPHPQTNDDFPSTILPKTPQPQPQPIASSLTTPQRTPTPTETTSHHLANDLALKAAEIDQLKEVVDRVSVQTTTAKEQLTERQTFLRGLNAQTAKTQQALSFVVTEGKQKVKGEQTGEGKK